MPRSLCYTQRSWNDKSECYQPAEPESENFDADHTATIPLVFKSVATYVSMGNSYQVSNRYIKQCMVAFSTKLYGIEVKETRCFERSWKKKDAGKENFYCSFSVEFLPVLFYNPFFFMRIQVHDVGGLFMIVV